MTNVSQERLSKVDKMVLPLVLAPGRKEEVHLIDRAGIWVGTIENETVAKEIACIVNGLNDLLAERDRYKAALKDLADGKHGFARPAGWIADKALKGEDWNV